MNTRRSSGSRARTISSTRHHSRRQSRKWILVVLVGWLVLAGGGAGWLGGASLAHIGKGVPLTWAESFLTTPLLTMAVVFGALRLRRGERIEVGILLMAGLAAGIVSAALVLSNMVR